MKSVSDDLVEMLFAAGIRRMYGIVGDSVNPVMEALHDCDKLRWINVRHEETGAFAACAEAQLTGRLAACCGSCGPGNMHLVNGLYDAYRSGGQEERKPGRRLSKEGKTHGMGHAGSPMRTRIFIVHIDQPA